MNNQKKNVVLIVILSIVGVLALLGVGVFLGLKMMKPSFSLKNTSWNAKNDGSEMVFTTDTINWYQTDGAHDDNYYSGTYKLYTGKDAVNFLVNDLSEYGYTLDEINAVFSRNEYYDESNFIIIDVNYDYAIVNGTKNTPIRPHVPYLGFVLQDGTYLDIANMNTSSYLQFIKK